jgi:hypothetical protein
MVCTEPKAHSTCNSRRDGEPQVLSIQRPRIRKKRGLSRHYPYKAQSFDCIADLFSSSSDEIPVMVLGKGAYGRPPSLCKFASCLSSASLERLPCATRANSVAMQVGTAGLDLSLASMESELCTAFEAQAAFNVASSPVGKCDEHECGSEINFGGMVENDR